MPRSKLASINIRNIDELQPTAETNAPPAVDTCIEDDGIQPSFAANVNTVGRDGQHRVRGRTTLRELWTLPPQDRILVSGNNIGQPVDEETRLLAGFLGMVARNGMKLPLHYETWHKVPQRTKDEALSFIKEKIRGAKIGRVELFRITHTKKDGSYLNETSQRIVEATKEKMVELEALADTSVNQQDLEDRAFIEVVGKERNGRVRGLGMGPTPSSYYGRQAHQFSQSNTQQEVFTLRERLQTMEAGVKELESERETQQAKFRQMQE